MKLESFRLLKKFMMMTTSSSEAEILMSIRKANEMIAEAGTDWNKVLDRVVTVELPFESAGAAYEKSRCERDEESGASRERRAAFVARVDSAFKAIESTDPRGSFADFISDVKNQWVVKRSLSAGQREAIFKAATKTGRWE